MTRLPRECPSCGEIFQPRKVGGAWTKTCSKPCANKATAKYMREGGARHAGKAVKHPIHVPITCEVCGDTWKLSPSHAKGRRTCSIACYRILKRREAGELAEARQGAKNPNWRNGARSDVRDRAGERRWYAALGVRCAMCGPSTYRMALHHICYAQHVRAEGGDRWDPRNALTLCASCHAKHHHGTPVALALLPDAAFAFVAELLGPDKAYNYLARRYAGEDARLDALLGAVAA